MAKSSATGNGFEKRPQDINRKGRPPAPSILNVIKKKVAENDGEKLDQIAAIVLEKAIEERDSIMLRDLLDRFDGKALQKIEISNEKDAEWLEAFRNFGKAEPETRDDTERVASQQTEDTDT